MTEQRDMLCPVRKGSLTRLHGRKLEDWPAKLRSVLLSEQVDKTITVASKV